MIRESGFEIRIWDWGLGIGDWRFEIRVTMSPDATSSCFFRSTIVASSVTCVTVPGSAFPKTIFGFQAQVFGF